MRRFLFRGKVRQTKMEKSMGKKPVDGTWVVGDLHYWNTGHPHIHFDMVSRVSIDPDTIGEFTGMTDKNGKDIFEGDIIRSVNGKKKVNGKWVDNEAIITVKYDIASFNVSCLALVTDSVEVIGNIYDNPELLEEKV
ncbi:MAG: hypothetical protein IJY03_04435 [Prevotella sp.]|nr:hypothetical protein [Prevotella sp.]